MSNDQQLLPAWKLLDPASLGGLLGAATAISVAPTRLEEVPKAPLISTIRSLIGRAAAENGLSLTATGNLSRAVVKVLFDELDWPDFDKETTLALNKVLNEPDVFPIHIARVVAEEGKLLRKRKSRLFATNLAKELVKPGNEAALFRTVFETLFWRINTAYFDRVPVEDWPQDHVGVVLWCLSASAHDWMSASELKPICTFPCEAESRTAWDMPSFALEARILRHLTWLGLMEMRSTVETEPYATREYRKAPAFDRMLRFDIQVLQDKGPAH